MNIAIPAEALEAGARATLEELDAIAGFIGATRVDGELTPQQWEFFHRIARAAFTAMVKAWPGMERHTFPESGSGDEYIPPIDEIFLPLTETPDGE